MDYEKIAANLNAVGLIVSAHDIKENRQVYCKVEGHKAKGQGAYFINTSKNLCLWSNFSEGVSSGAFVLNKEKIVNYKQVRKDIEESERELREKYKLAGQNAEKEYKSNYIEVIKAKPLETDPTKFKPAKWVEIQDNDVNHAYLQKKGISAHDIKISKDNKILVIPLYEFKEDSSNNLALQIKNIQFIYENGFKHYKEGCQSKGAMHFIGCEKLFQNLGNATNFVNKEYSGHILIAEGYATGASLHQATGKPVVVALTAGNLDPTIDKLIRAYPKSDLVICADNDYKTEINHGKNVGILAAKLCSEKYKIPYIYPQFEEAHKLGNSDFNDMHALYGINRVKESILEVTSLISIKQINSGIVNDYIEISQKCKDEIVLIKCGAWLNAYNDSALKLSQIDGLALREYQGKPCIGIHQDMLDKYSESFKKNGLNIVIAEKQGQNCYRLNFQTDLQSIQNNSSTQDKQLASSPITQNNSEHDISY